MNSQTINVHPPAFFFLLLLLLCPSLTSSPHAASVHPRNMECPECSIQIGQCDTAQDGGREHHACFGEKKKNRRGFALLVFCFSSPLLVILYRVFVHRRCCLEKPQVL
ncbi:MAG: hypothetical protein J3Q66DRAFT_34990 [Benniella sp.]|nr:MAG: hypothetical protein J3Q66DRAFT_34990 [Benniella sp.]